MHLFEHAEPCGTLIGASILAMVSLILPVV